MQPPRADYNRRSSTSMRVSEVRLPLSAMMPITSTRMRVQPEDARLLDARAGRRRDIARPIRSDLGAVVDLDVRRLRHRRGAAILCRRAHAGPTIVGA
jgi:hypothetical protein